LITVVRIRGKEIPSAEDILGIFIAAFLTLLLSAFVLCALWYAMACLGGLGNIVHAGFTWLISIDHDLAQHHYRLNWNYWTPAEIRLMIWSAIALLLVKKVWAVVRTP